MDGIILMTEGAFPDSRIGSDSPTHYRLARKGESELVLQGWFSWREGNRFGGEWREIPIVEWWDTTPPAGRQEPSGEVAK